MEKLFEWGLAEWGAEVEEKLVERTRDETAKRQQESLSLSSEYYEALKLGEVLVAYGRMMMIGHGGAGKTSLRYSLMNENLPLYASSTLLANALSVKYKWTKLGDKGSQYWTEVVEGDELDELASLLQKVVDLQANPSIVSSVVTMLRSEKDAIAVNLFKPSTHGSQLPSSDSEKSLSAESVIKDILKAVHDRLAKQSRRQHQRSDVFIRIWDCGGQLVFLNILPAFLTSRTLFMLTFDASKDLNKKLQVATVKQGRIVHTEDYHLSTTELILQWMASIHSHFSLRKQNGSLERFPRIMLVGTHRDKVGTVDTFPPTTSSLGEVSVGDLPTISHDKLTVPHVSTPTPTTSSTDEASVGVMLTSSQHGESSVVAPPPTTSEQSIRDHLHSHYEDKYYADLLLPSPLYFVDNTRAGKGENEDPVVKEIRQTVQDFVSDDLSVPTPVTWVLFRKVMQSVFKDKTVVKLQEVKAVAKACFIPPEAVLSVLNFYHQLGVFLYFADVPALRDVVITDPQWLIDNFAKILCPKGLTDHGMERHWKLLHSKGILVQELYEKVLAEAGIEPQTLVDLLDHFLLAAPVPPKKNHPYASSKWYFVPSMLSGSSRYSHPRHSDAIPTCKAETVHLTFSSHYVPPGFFVRLIASIAREKQCTVSNVDCLNVTFIYGEVDKLRLKEINETIEVHMSRHKERQHSPSFASSCQEVLQMLQSKFVDVSKWLPCTQTAFSCTQCKSDQFLPITPTTYTTSVLYCDMCEQHFDLTPEQQYWLKDPPNAELEELAGGIQELSTSAVTGLQRPESGIEHHRSSSSFYVGHQGEAHPSKGGGTTAMRKKTDVWKELSPPQGDVRGKPVQSNRQTHGSTRTKEPTTFSVSRRFQEESSESGGGTSLSEENECRRRTPQTRKGKRKEKGPSESEGGTSSTSEEYERRSRKKPQTRKGKRKEKGFLESEGGTSSTSEEYERRSRKNPQTRKGKRKEKGFLAQKQPASSDMVQAEDFADFPAPKVWELGDAVAEIPHLWKEVGLGLGLSPGDLRGIQENTAGQVRQAQKCFTEVFISWKDGRMSPYTWEMLVSVLLQRRLATDTRQLVTDLHKTLSDRYARIR